MVQLTLPKNSTVKKGKTWNAAGKTSGPSQVMPAAAVTYPHAASRISPP